MMQEGLVVVLGPDTPDPATAHVGGRAKFLLGVWGISTLWSTINYTSPCLSCKDRAALCWQRKYCSMQWGWSTYPGRDGKETGQEVQVLWDWWKRPQQISQVGTTMHRSHPPVLKSPGCRSRDCRPERRHRGVVLYVMNQDIKYYCLLVKNKIDWNFLTESCFVAHDTCTGFTSSICTMLRAQTARIGTYTRQSWAVPLISPSWSRSCSLKQLIRKKCRLLCSWGCNGVISSWRKFLEHPH